MATTLEPSTDKCEPFPDEARAYLDKFYSLRSVSLNDISGKILALRKAFDMQDTIITADGGINDDEMELHALEFYVLTTQGLL